MSKKKPDCEEAPFGKPVPAAVVSQITARNECLRHIESHLSMALNLAVNEDLPDVSHHTKLALNATRDRLSMSMGVFLP